MAKYKQTKTQIREVYSARILNFQKNVSGFLQEDADNMDNETLILDIRKNSRELCMGSEEAGR